MISKHLAAESGPAVDEVLAALAAVLAAQARLRGRDARQPGDLSFAQMRLLAGLEGDIAVPTGHLAERAGVSPGTATGMLDHLEEAGLVVRTRGAEDRRVVLTRLTGEGRRRRDRRRREARRALARALEPLDAERLAEAAAVLRLLAGAMEEM